jgi:hypothetical protein
MTTIKDADLTREYLDIIEDLDGDMDSRRASYKYMLGSTAIVHHQVVDCSFVPRLFTKEAYDAMKRNAEGMHKVLVKVMQHYLDDPEYRKVFDFDERLRELILLPRGYDSLLPFARVDTFLNEDDFTCKLCEVNGDGSSGMNENREITNSILESESFKTFAQNHTLTGCELFESWVDAFIKIYGTYVHKVDSPTFAICDYLENGVVDEFHMFAKLFCDKGYDCVVEDVRNLHFDGNELKNGEGKRIDAIWRRCVTNDVLEFWDESQDLIEAVRAEKVALIGSFAGHIVHDKQIFEVLFKRETQEFLTADEISLVEQIVPMTAFLNDDEVNIDQIRAHKDEWIIKPSDHYGSDNVYAGLEQTQEQWDALIDKFANNRVGYPFIVQRFMTPFKTQILPPDNNIDRLPDGDVSLKPMPYNNLNGLYLYDGKFAGVFSRLGPHPTINKQNEGITAATVWVDFEPDAPFARDLQPA